MRYLLVLAFVCTSSANDEIVAKAKRLSVGEHVELIQKLGDALRDRLLKADPQLQARQPKGVSVNRILNRGRFKNELGVRGGGAYFSFVTQSNDYDRVPNIELQQWRFQSGFAGNDFGFVKVLAVESLSKVALKDVPDMLKLPARKFHEVGRAHRRKLWQQQNRHDAQGPPEPAYPPADVGKVYVVRSVVWRDADVLAVFQILAKDEFGVTFAWKVLKNFPNPARQRR